MYTVRRVNPEGLGFAPWIIPLVIAIAGSAGGAVATRLIVGPSSPSQKRVESELKLQHELEIKRMLEQQKIQQQQTGELGKYVLPALGLVALVALLR